MLPERSMWDPGRGEREVVHRTGSWSLESSQRVCHPNSKVDMTGRPYPCSRVVKVRRKCEISRYKTKKRGCVAVRIAKTKRLLGPLGRANNVAIRGGLFPLGTKPANEQGDSINTMYIKSGKPKRYVREWIDPIRPTQKNVSSAD